MDNVLKRYKRRPICLEQFCYADFASWYDVCRKSEKVHKNDTVCLDEELPEPDYDL